MSLDASAWKQAIRTGLTGGGVVVLLSLVGIVVTFGQRFIVSGLVSMGQIFFLAPLLLLSYTAVRRMDTQSKSLLPVVGGISGLIGALVIALLLMLGKVVDLRAIFPNASPALYNMLSFQQSGALGIVILLLAGFVTGGIGASILLIPARWRNAVTQVVIWLILVGLLRDLLMTVINRWGTVAFLVRWMFAQSGLTLPGAIALFLVVGGLTYWRGGRKAAPPREVTPKQQQTIRLTKIAGTALVLLVLPPVLGIFFSEVLDNVGLYILMGLGLNIVVGFAGLLDLGYVAFFAIGAYTMGVLTSPELGFFEMTYWQALPFALGMCVLAGLALGLPVLKMRGDYLAIVTLGFGEIIRLLALSDWLRPFFGGTQGIQLIARPKIGGFELASQTELYYLIMAGIGVAGFIAWRLKDSRLGRSWMALREDEDVAQAMGINLVATKLMAFATGAFFAGLSGTIFAAKLASVYPHSMNFLVSINVLCLLIIGGMGSIPGVLVGALALIGAPELLREFAEFRYLVYGALLVIMMLTRPEGLWPEERRRLELHEEQELVPGVEPQAALKTPGQ